MKKLHYYLLIALGFFVVIGRSAELKTSTYNVALKMKPHSFVRGEDVWVEVKAVGSRETLFPWFDSHDLFNALVVKNANQATESLEGTRMSVIRGINEPRPVLKKMEASYNLNNGEDWSKDASRDLGFLHLAPGVYSVYFKKSDTLEVKSDSLTFVVTEIPEHQETAWRYYALIRRLATPYKPIEESKLIALADSVFILGEEDSADQLDPPIHGFNNPLSLDGATAPPQAIVDSSAMLDSVRKAVAYFQARPQGSLWRPEALHYGLHAMKIFSNHWTSADTLMALNAIDSYGKEFDRESGVVSAALAGFCQSGTDNDWPETIKWVADHLQTKKFSKQLHSFALQLRKIQNKNG